MKYDDASWHSGRDFPKDSPEEFGETHIALMLKWCFIKGWAGPLHLQENRGDVEKLIRGKKSATEYFFQWCDGKFTDEYLTPEGNAFVAFYYGDGGAYLEDYGTMFGDRMFVVGEEGHDFVRFSQMVERRYQEFLGPPSKRPRWKFW
jgi:hypothetical protein